MISSRAPLGFKIGVISSIVLLVFTIYDYKWSNDYILNNLCALALQGTLLLLGFLRVHLEITYIVVTLATTVLILISQIITNKDTLTILAAAVAIIVICLTQGLNLYEMHKGVSMGVTPFAVWMAWIIEIIILLYKAGFLGLMVKQDSSLSGGKRDDSDDVTTSHEDCTDAKDKEGGRVWQGGAPFTDGAVKAHLPNDPTGKASEKSSTMVKQKSLLKVAAPDNDTPKPMFSQSKFDELVTGLIILDNKLKVTLPSMEAVIVDKKNIDEKIENIKYLLERLTSFCSIVYSRIQPILDIEHDLNKAIENKIDEDHGEAAWEQAKKSLHYTIKQQIRLIRGDCLIRSEMSLILQLYTRIVNALASLKSELTASCDKLNMNRIKEFCETLPNNEFFQLVAYFKVFVSPGTNATAFPRRLDLLTKGLKNFSIILFALVDLYCQLLQ